MEKKDQKVVKQLSCEVVVLQYLARVNILVVLTFFFLPNFFYRNMEYCKEYKNINNSNLRVLFEEVYIFKYIRRERETIT